MTRASTLARDATFVYALLIVYATLHPFTGWRDQGLSPLAWVGTWPKSIIVNDFTFNVAAYVPLGWMLVWALVPRFQRAAAWLLAIVLAAALSLVLESLQTYLPTRVPASSDLLANSLGALAGATVGALLASQLLERGALKALNERWLGARAPRSLILAGLWVFAALYPQGMLFGYGSLATILGPISGYPFTPVEFARVEAAVTGASLFAAGSLFVLGLTAQAPRWFLLILFVGAACGVRAFSHTILFSPDVALAWLTPGAQQGLIAGSIALLFSLFLPRTMLLALVVIALTFSTVVVNLAPANPYYAAIVQALNPGRFLNFNGVTQTVAALWPFLAALYVLFALPDRTADQ